MDFSRTRFSLRRPLCDYTKIQRLYSRFIRCGAWQLRSRVLNARLREHPYLNIGCGLNVHPGFVNLDYYWRPGVMLCWDICRGLPRLPTAVAGIHTEHCLEHVPLEAAARVLGGCLAALQPGGTLRVVVPDAGMYLDLYARRQAGQDIRFPYVTDKQRQNGTTPMMAVNRVFRADGHQFAYDEETLHGLLHDSGFVDIKRAAFRVGRDAHLLIDTESRACESLYMEASRSTTGGALSP